MNGAREYAELFETGQYGRLYIVSGSHARGKTFEIYVLPEGEKAISNGAYNAPLNKDAVEVYGAICGTRGWNESYGWKYEGKWQEDFYTLAKNRKERIEALRDEKEKRIKDELEERKKKDLALLAKYR